jgi:hypothetical protein
MPNGAAWTGADTEQLRLLARSGMNDADIAKKMHRDRTFIVKKRAEHGIQRGQSAGLTTAIPVGGRGSNSPSESKSDSLERLTGREPPTYQPKAKSIPWAEKTALPLMSADCFTWAAVRGAIR